MKRPDIRVARNEATPTIPPRPRFDEIVSRVPASSGTHLPWKWIITGTAAVAVAIVAWLFSTGKSTAPETEKPVIAATKLIAPPVAQWDVAYDTFTVNVAAGDTLIYRGCSKIIVPPGGIVKNNGATISTTQILYREFHNTAEILAAGIPMGYDSAGNIWHLESAGMFEIRSLAGDEKVAGNSITVNMCTTQPQSGFNDYYLDTAQKNWVYRGAVKTVPQRVPQADSAVPENPYKKNEPGSLAPVETPVVSAETKMGWDQTNIQEKLPEPKMRSASGYTFSVEESFIPELNVYKNVEFEVLPGQGYDPDKLPEDWDYIKIDKTNKSGIYMLSLFNGSKVYRYKVFPVFTNATDYKSALAAFQKQEKQQLDQINRQKKEAAAEAARQQIEAEKMAKEFNAQQKSLSQQPKNSMNYSGMITSFTVNQFGYYNSDRPISNANNSIQLDYSIDQQGNKNTQGQLYQYYLNRNSVMVNYDFSPGLVKLKYADGEDYLLLAILQDNKSIAILSPEEFRTEVAEKRNGQIILHSIDEEFKSADDIQNYVNKNFRMKSRPK